MSLSTTRAPLSIDALRDAVRGRVITADDPDYDAVRAIMYCAVTTHDLRPSSGPRMRPTSRHVVDDRARVRPRAGRPQRWSQRRRPQLVRRRVVIDVRDLDGLDIDVAGRTAWAGSGLTAGAYTTAAAEHGLATGFGDTGSVGLGGLTLGGGVGYLVRKHGLTIDNLLAAEIVTADGQVRIVDADNEPDLFWAIRGGGGNFGVATRFRYRLHELDGVVGGMLVLPATPETVAGFIAAAEAAPEELSTIANVMSCPPMPFVPEEYHGSIVILGMLAYAGDAEAGEQALAPFRALAEPLADMLRPIPYPEMFPPDDPDYHPTAVSRTMFIDHVDLPVAQTIVEYLTASDASMRVAQLRVLGGASARVPVDATAYAHRAARIMVNVAAFYEGEDDKPRREAWVAEFSAAIHQGDAGSLRQLRWRRGRDTRPGGISRGHLGSAGRDQAPLRPGQPVPPQPEHPAGHGLSRQPWRRCSGTSRG